MNLKTLNPKPCTLYPNSAFTLIETLVVVGIMTMLSGFLIVYTRSSENQIKILKDKAAFISAIYKARSQAIRTIQTDPPECGYGVRVLDERSYVIWHDTASSPDCKDKNSLYDGPHEDVGSVMRLSPGIKFGNINDAEFLKDILFIPPDPRVITVPDSATTPRFRVVIGTNDQTSEASIGINKYGQIENAEGY